MTERFFSPQRHRVTEEFQLLFFLCASVSLWWILFLTGY